MESSLGEYSSHPSAQWHNNSGKSQRFREEILPETSSMKHNNENHPGGLKSGLYCGTNLPIKILLPGKKFAEIAADS